MAFVYLIEGPVGAGKSTYAASLAEEHNALHLNLDAWMVNLFRPDRPATEFLQWYGERKARCIEQIWAVGMAVYERQMSVILELGLVQYAARSAVYARAAEQGLELRVTVLDVARGERRRRVAQRNLEQGATYQMTVSDEVFALADQAWEPPNLAEIEAHDISFINN